MMTIDQWPRLLYDHDNDTTKIWNTKNSGLKKMWRKNADKMGDEARWRWKNFKAGMRKRVFLGRLGEDAIPLEKSAHWQEIRCRKPILKKLEKERKICEIISAFQTYIGVVALTFEGSHEWIVLLLSRGEFFGVSNTCFILIKDPILTH